MDRKPGRRVYKLNKGALTKYMCIYIHMYFYVSIFIHVYRYISERGNPFLLVTKNTVCASFTGHVGLPEPTPQRPEDDARGSLRLDRKCLPEAETGPF